MTDLCVRRHRAALLVLVLLSCPALAGSSSAQTSLCEPEEQAVWSCETKGKTYSVCASADLGATSGYLQYRAGKPSAIEFRHPGEPKHPKGVFVFSLLARGASLTFENEGHEYTIYEPLMGGTTIDVRKEGRELATIPCDSATETLTLTTTINQMKAWGIVD